MPGNRAVAYIGPGQVEVHTIDYPGLELKDGPGVNPANVGRKCPHGVILKVVSTNICGSDQHMVRGRTTAPEGSSSATRSPARSSRPGRTWSSSRSATWSRVPFNIACGRCRNCKERKTGICLNVNPDRPGSAYGYVDMGGWVGGQAEYVMVPYADWNLLKFPDKDQAMEKILDLTMLSDIFPTGYHGAYTAGRHHRLDRVRRGRRAGRARRAYSAQLLGAAVVIVGDMNPERLKQAAASAARPSTCRRATPKDQIEQILGEPEVDAAVDASGSRRAATGHAASEAPATVLNSSWTVTRAGGRLGIPGLYVTGDPGGVDEDAKDRLAVDPARPRLGQVALLHHRPVPGDEVPPRPDDGDPERQGADRQGGERHRDLARPGPQGYKDFDRGAARKYVIDPHGMMGSPSSPSSPPSSSCSSSATASAARRSSGPGRSCSPGSCSSR
jgi:glutathione-independent formaldehyde dehydrogenase